MPQQEQGKATELFKVISGMFMGWRVGDDFFGRNGKRAGRFVNDKLYWDSGAQLGWVYPADPRRIGLRNGYGMVSIADRGTNSSSVNFTVPKDLPRNADGAWSDTI